MLNRQQMRQAERRLIKGRFPFPELQEWLRGYLKDHSEYFAQVDPGGTEILTNLTGEVETYGIGEFHEVLMELKNAE